MKQRTNTEDLIWLLITVKYQTVKKKATELISECKVVKDHWLIKTLTVHSWNLQWSSQAQIGDKAENQRQFPSSRYSNSLSTAEKG